MFEAFCQASNLQVVPGSLLQPDPPAPDITASLRGTGDVAFELVRLDDNAELKSFSDLRNATNFLEAEFDRLPAKRREALRRRFSDAEITIEFLSSTSMADRRGALARLWKMFERLSDAVNGRLDLRALEAPAGLSSVWIIRAERHEKPRFRSFSLVTTHRVVTKRVIDKLGRFYPSDTPLELLAYKEIGTFAYIDDLDVLKTAIVEHLPLSRFRMVWAYECMTRSVHGFPNPPKNRTVT